MPLSRRDWAIEQAQRLAPLFGVAGFDFRLSTQDRNLLIAISLLPMLVLTLVFVNLAIEVIGPGSGRTFSLVDDWEGRLIGATYNGTTALAYAAMASVFVGALGRVSRPVASWAAVAACAFAAVSFVAGCFIVFVALDDATPFLGVHRYYARVWERLANVSGFLAIGYAFLAYRGLSGTRPHGPGTGNGGGLNSARNAPRYFTTRYFTCVTFGAATVRTNSSFRSEPTCRTAAHLRRGRSVRCAARSHPRRPAARYCCATLAPPPSETSFSPAAA